MKIAASSSDVTKQAFLAPGSRLDAGLNRIFVATDAAKMEHLFCSRCRPPGPIMAIMAGFDITLTFEGVMAGAAFGRAECCVHIVKKRHVPQHRMKDNNGSFRRCRLYADDCVCKPTTYCNEHY